VLTHEKTDDLERYDEMGYQIFGLSVVIAFQIQCLHCRSID